MVPDSGRDRRLLR